MPSEVPLLRSILVKLGGVDIGGSEVPLYKAIVQALGGTPAFASEVPLLRQIVKLSGGAGNGATEVPLMREWAQAIGVVNPDGSEVFLLEQILSGININTVDPIAESYFSRVQLAGGSFNNTSTNPSATDEVVRLAIDRFTKKLRLYGVLTKIKHLWFPVTNSLTGITKSLIGGDVTLNGGYVAGNWVYNTGLLHATNRFVVCPSSATGQDWSMGVYAAGNTVANTEISMDDGTLTNRLHLFGSTDTSWRSPTVTSGAGSSRALYSFSNSSSDIFGRGYRDGVKSSVSAAQYIIPTGFNYQLNKGGTGLYGADRTFGSYSASNLTDAEMLVLGSAFRKLQADLFREPQQYILVVGDSITAGQGSTPNFGSQMGTTLGMRAVSAGFPGGTLIPSAGLNAEWPFTLRYQDVINTYPDAYHYYFQYGVNDMRRPEQNASGFQAAMETICNWMINIKGIPASKITIGTPGYLTTNPPSRAAFQAAVLAAATNTGVIFKDVYTAMLNGGGDALLVDGIHPNPTGAGVMASALLS